MAKWSSVQSIDPTAVADVNITIAMNMEIDDVSTQLVTRSEFVWATYLSASTDRVPCSVWQSEPLAIGIHAFVRTDDGDASLYCMLA